MLSTKFHLSIFVWFFFSHLSSLIQSSQRPFIDCGAPLAKKMMVLWWGIQALTLWLAMELLPPVVTVRTSFCYVDCMQFLPKCPWITESFVISVYMFLIIPTHSPSSHHDRLPSPSHWHNYCTADINPLPPMSDRDRISPYNINAISCVEVMRIK